MSAETKAGLIAVQGDRVPLEGVEIAGEATGAYARVRLAQRYRNADPKPIEAIYTFPLPSDASLVGFSMTCGGRRIESVIREREQAFREYDEAISSGHGAALVDQERPNVFTAQVGNLLPGEETLVELEYLQRVSVDEGTLRWMIPTLVAPRYIPGTATGDRTAHGRVEPTDQVADADRISPPVGSPNYGVRMKLLFDIGGSIHVESPSHSIQVARVEGRTQVTFAQDEVALDRDIVLTVRGAAGSPLSAVSSHCDGDKPGVFSVTVVPDLFDDRPPRRQDLLFLLDISGSMSGASIAEARTALRLCLRQLREGDQFNAIAFNDRQHKFADEPVPFTQKTLDDADRWVDSLQAAGGTELLPAIKLALQSAPDVLILLTDGQVGNENEILRAVVQSGARTRIYSFGIGTNVSDVLLKDLSLETSGAVELVHPGERIDEKVIAQFARAIAPRVSDVSVTFHGLEVRDLAPEKPRALVDGDAWVLFGRYDLPGRGQLELRGTRDGEPFLLKLPLELGGDASLPHLAKLWAAERIRDLEASRVAGRRGDAIRRRILELALEHGIASPYTSFIAIERRSDERRTAEQPQMRVVPVHAPAGWAMFEPKEDWWPTSVRMRTRGARISPTLGILGMMKGPAAAVASGLIASARSRIVRAGFITSMADSMDGALAEAERARVLPGCSEAQSARPGDPVAAILARQLASGLWDQATEATRAGQVRATALALLDLLQAGITSSDARHGPQIRKAIEALLKLASEGIDDRRWLELALGVAWLCATGPRTRAHVDAALRSHGVSDLPLRNDGGRAMRKLIDALATELR
jgi:Ca-activated chloride channel family protein